MYTLKYKVLSNKLSQATMFSFITWIATSLIGSVGVSLLNVTGMPYYQVAILSLLFSSPANVILTPAFAMRSMFMTKVNRLIYISATAILSCIAIIALFLVTTEGYPLDQKTIVSLLTPYVLSAGVTVPINFIVIEHIYKK